MMENIQKKKKGKFWLVLLIIILTVVTVVFTVRGVKKLLSNWMDGLLSESPFTFETGDYYAYVTQNFTCDTEVYDSYGKGYPIAWSCDSDSVNINTDCSVTIERPAEQNETVNFTATVKWLFLKAERSYPLTLVRTASLKAADVYVPSSSELTSGTARYAYSVSYDTNGLPVFINGKLNVSVYSYEDAVAVMEAYRAFFKVSSAISFKCNTVNAETDGKHFIVSMYNCGAEFLGYTFTVSTNATGKLTSISGSAPTSLPNKTSLIEEKALESRLKKAYGNNTVIQDASLCIEGGKFVWYVIYSQNEAYYTVSMNATTGAIISKTTLQENLTISTTDTRGRKVSVTVDDIGLFGTLRDSSRKIHVFKYKDPEDSKAYNKIIENNKKSSSSPSTELSLYDETFTPLVEWLAANMTMNDFRVYNVTDSTASDVEVITALANMQKVYDWYKALGYLSADGKGSTINILTHSPSSENNASCIGIKNSPYVLITTGRGTGSYQGAACEYLDVIAHEYTHARFRQYNSYISGSNTELSAISEAYSDIFGCFVEGNWLIADEWVNGSPLRDIPNVTYCNGKTCPLDYKDIDFATTNCHYSSMLLSLCAYEMETIAGLSREQNILLWYKAITYGLNNKTTFVTIRSYIEAAARFYGYNEETIEKIGNVFGAHDIGTYKVLNVINKTVAGDELLDDTVTRRFVVFGSPVGISLFDTPMVVMNNNYDLLGSLTARSEEEIGTVLGNASGHTVSYMRSSTDAQNLLLSFVENTKQELSDKIGDVSEYTNYLFFCYVYECTAYEFVTEVLEIDPDTLK